MDPYFTIDGVSRGIDLYFRETTLMKRGLSTTPQMRLESGYPLAIQSVMMRALGQILRSKT